MNDSKMWALKDLRITKVAIIKSMIKVKQIVPADNSNIEDHLAYLTNIVYSVTEQDKKNMLMDNELTTIDPLKKIKEEFNECKNVKELKKLWDNLSKENKANKELIEFIREINLKIKNELLNKI